MALPEVGRATCAEWAELAAAHADALAWVGAAAVLMCAAVVVLCIVAAALWLDSRAARRHAALKALLADLPGRGDYYRDLAEALLRRDGRQ